MPSYCIHLAIGNLYAKKNKIMDKESFDAGIIAPDFAKDKEASHYSAPRDKANLVDFLHKKVQLAEYLKKNKIDTDFRRGEFLHLVTDYIYFTQFFTPEFINSFPDGEFMTSMYYSYDLIKQPVEEKYNVVYPGDLAAVIKAIEEKRKLLGFDKGVTKPNVLPMEKLERFIDFCASIDLEKFAGKINSLKLNISPDEGEFC